MTPPSQDEEHLRLLSIFHYVFGGLVAVGATIPIIHVIIGVVIAVSASFDRGHGGGPPVWLGLLIAIIGGALVLGGWTVAGLMLYAGRCLWRRTRYVFCLVVAAISCLFVPLGTVLGVFTIIVLNRPSVKTLFAQTGPPRAA
jgi:hypothetical protein